MVIAIDAYLGLGANLGDRVQSIIDARTKLSQLPYCSKILSSSLYWSSPVGYADQPGFINCAVRLTINVSAITLFQDMQIIESSLGRQRCKGNQNAPRTIDLDLLLFGDQQINSKNLQVPHPRMLDRRFVIEPLLEIAGDIRVSGEVLASLYAELQTQDRYKAQELHRLGK